MIDTSRAVTKTQAFLRWAPCAGGLMFLLSCFSFSWHGPGMQYDEALSVRGAVDLTAKAARSMPCVPGVDMKIQRRCWPLMIAPYVGSVKDYVAAPFFRVFGIHVFVARLTAALFGSLGIIGFATFLRDRIDVMTGAAFAIVMAVQPTYLDQVLFDNGNIAVSMGFIGIAAWAGNRLLGSRSSTWAFVLGVACGVAVWGRLNFSWILIAVLIGIVAAFRWRQLFQWKAWLLILAGSLVGAFPMLSYHWTNRSALRSFISTNSVYHNVPGFLKFLVYRTQMISEVLFSDREHREIWESGTIFNGGARFYWLIGLAAALWCVVRRPAQTNVARRARCLGVASITLLVICLTTQLQIAEHHLVVLIPFIAVCAVICLMDIGRLGRTAQIIAFTLGVMYVGAALGLDTKAALRIHESRGLGMWSDAIDSVNDTLQSDRTGTPVNVLDWGLQANLFFVSKATIAAPELFWGANVEKSDRQITWAEEVAKGGRFLTTSTQDRVFPAATAGFEKALASTKAKFQVQVFKQRSGAPYALLYTVDPKSPMPAHIE